MKILRKLFIPLFIMLLTLSSINTLHADGGLVAFYKVGMQKGTIDGVAEQVKIALENENFEILGEYNPGKNQNMYVIVFTREDLKNITFQIEDRGILASILRVGLLADGNGNVEITLLNPEYIFYAYLRDEITYFETELLDISTDVKIAMRKVGQEFLPFGTGSLTEEELKYFRFLPKDPSFDDPIILNTFSSFKKGVRTINSNLRSRRDGTYMVYELINEEKKIAIYGVGLLHDKKGEGIILEELGKDHLAAFPYEIVLIGNEASILPGEYRFPLFWSDLTMKEFRRIYRTHRDVQETMEKVTKDN